MEENRNKNDTAYLSNKNSYIIFKFRNRVIRFKGPYSLIKISKIKEWDKGYIVVDAEYTHSKDLVEDYIDLIPILEDLYIDADAFLSQIRKVELQNV